MVAKIEPTDRQWAGAAAGSDDEFNQQLRAVVEQRVDLQPNHPEEDEPWERDDLRPVIRSYLDHQVSDSKLIYSRLVAIENEVKKRGSRSPRRFRRYLAAILIGVAGTLAWQSYGESAKQLVATRAPELGWSPEAKQMIATSIQSIGWTKPPAGPEKQTPPVAPTAPTSPSLDSGRVQQMTQNLAALRQTVEQLAGGQDQIARQIARLETAVAGLKPTPVPPSSHTPSRQ
jgi:hypothetical protein